MRVVFSPASCIPFLSNTLLERPLGGTESSVIRLAEALVAEGIDTYVTTPFDNPPLSSPRYISDRSLHLLGDVDAWIIVRDWRAAFAPIKAKRRFFWSGDAYDQVVNIGLGDKRVSSRFDALLAVSEWQKESTVKASRFPVEKTKILRNGIYLPNFKDVLPRNRKRLIYTSTPYRGLEHMVTLFPKIKEQVSDAEFVVCSGYEVYADHAGRADPALLKEWEELRRKLAKIDGITIRGNLKQQELAKELLQASVLAYPNTFAETSCISVLEAQAAGCVPVTSNKAALPETVSNAGVLISGEPGEDEYDRNFIDSCVKLLTDDAHWQNLSNAGIAKSKNEGWENRARDLLKLI